jgi:hypothetical protein
MGVLDLKDFRAYFDRKNGVVSFHNKDLIFFGKE